MVHHLVAVKSADPALRLKNVYRVSSSGRLYRRVLQPNSPRHLALEPKHKPWGYLVIFFVVASPMIGFGMLLARRAYANGEEYSPAEVGRKGTRSTVRFLGSGGKG